MYENGLKKLKETKEENKMLKNKKRNNINSFGCSYKKLPESFAFR